MTGRKDAIGLAKSKADELEQQVAAIGGWSVLGKEIICSQEAWLEYLSKDKDVLRASRAYLDKLRADLGGPAPSPLEALLIERIIETRIALTVAEHNSSRTDIALTQAAYWQKVCDQAHRQHESSIRTLAVVRRLAVPPFVQVNVLQDTTATR